MQDDRHTFPDERIIFLFRARDGALTNVELESGDSLRVYNIAWGYDIGDSFAHITTNISPNIDGEEADFFFSNEIRAIRDASGKLLLTVSSTTTNMSISWR